MLSLTIMEILNQNFKLSLKVEKIKNKKLNSKLFNIFKSLKNQFKKMLKHNTTLTLNR